MNREQIQSEEVIIGFPGESVQDLRPQGACASQPQLGGSQGEAPWEL